MAAKALSDGLAIFGFKGSQADVEHLALRHDDHVEAWRNLVSTEDLSNQSFSSISLDSGPKLLGCRDAEPAKVSIAGEDKNREIAPAYTGTTLVNQLEISATTYVLVTPETSRRHPVRRYSSLTVRRLRPFARRRFNTRRPFLVAIRTRNPWVRLRCRLFG